MNEPMKYIIGKTVQAVDEAACNAKTILFTDGTALEMEVALVNGAVGLYGITVHIVPGSAPPEYIKRRRSPTGTG